MRLDLSRFSRRRLALIAVGTVAVAGVAVVSSSADVPAARAAALKTCIFISLSVDRRVCHGARLDARPLRDWRQGCRPQCECPGSA